MNKPNESNFSEFLVHEWTYDEPEGTRCGITLKEWLAKDPSTSPRGFASVLPGFTTCEECITRVGELFPTLVVQFKAARERAREAESAEQGESRRR